MNYTNPKNKNHKDKPEEWLNSSLLFVRALSVLLPNNFGVVIDVMGDAKNPINENNKKVIISHKNNMIHIEDIEDVTLDEGEFVSFIDE